MSKTPIATPGWHRADKRKTFSAGDSGNGPDFVFPHIFGTETEAKNAASAHSGHFKRNEAHFHGALRPGIIAPAAGGIITTAGFGDDDDRSWTIKHKTTAFHDGIEISFQCEAKAENPPAQEDSGGSSGSGSGSGSSSGSYQEAGAPSGGSSVA